MKRSILSTHRFALILLLVASIYLSGCQAIKDIASPQPTLAPAPIRQDDSTVIAEGHVVPKDFTNLFFTLPGPVTEILVQEGELITKGTELVRLGERQSFEASLASAELGLLNSQQQLDDLNEKAAIAASQAKLAVLDAETAFMEAQKRLEDLDTNETQDKIDDARKVVSDIADELKDAQDEFDKYKDLSVDNQNRKDAADKLKEVQNNYNQAVRDRDTLLNDLERLREEFTNAQVLLDQARRDAEARQSGPDQDQLALAEAQVKNAKTQLDAAKSALDKLTLVAPYDGKILRIDIAVGERVQANQTVLVLADTSSWYIETSDLTETEVVKISPGQSVIIKPDAIPDAEIKGTVESIDDTFIERSGDITYTVRVRLENPDPLLRWGMTVEASFEK